MAIIRDRVNEDHLTIDATSKAARFTPYLFDDANTVQLNGQTQTFRSTSPLASFTPPGSPTDLVTFSGSPRRTVRVTKLGFSLIKSTAAAQISVFLVRRNSANLGGVSVALPVVEVGNKNNLGSSANPVVYTTNPTTLGNLLGNLWSGKLAVPLATTAGIASGRDFMGGSADSGSGLSGINIDFQETYGQPITLRGNQESISINIGGVAVTGFEARFYIQWQESDS